jgi:hypothetical protein
MAYKKVKEDGRTRSGPPKNPLLEAHPWYNYKLKIPIEVRVRAKDLGMSVQDFVFELILKDLENI